MNTPVEIKWACPKCGADANKHGKGGKEKCLDNRRDDECCGLLCECDGDTDEKHGSNFEDPCTNAFCHHCEWSGVFPVKPKGLLPFEKKALEAGWSPPKKRKKELGL